MQYLGHTATKKSIRCFSEIHISLSVNFSMFIVKSETPCRGPPECSIVSKERVSLLETAALSLTATVWGDETGKLCGGGGVGVGRERGCITLTLLFSHLSSTAF